MLWLYEKMRFNDATAWHHILKRSEKAVLKKMSEWPVQLKGAARRRWKTATHGLHDALVIRCVAE
jgi:hypothetical protein